MMPISTPTSDGGKPIAFARRLTLEILEAKPLQTATKPIG
jgi:hypothetical protein